MLRNYISYSVKDLLIRENKNLFAKTKIHRNIAIEIKTRWVLQNQKNLR
jgi:hypothetical protein